MAGRPTSGKADGDDGDELLRDDVACDDGDAGEDFLVANEREAPATRMRGVSSRSAGGGGGGEAGGGGGDGDSAGERIDAAIGEP